MSVEFGGRLAKISSYHFSCGNSNTGSIGFCARVNATSKRKALAILQDCVTRSIPIEHKLEFAGDSDAHQVEYVEVYLNPLAITVNDIDEMGG
jgi:hypothetical protein